MIRFSCPGCGATYTVGDEKGGKTGKCPKCQSQFQIPQAEGAPKPPSAPKLPPVPPPGDPNATVEIAPCPGCQARLSVTNADLGADVECPYCQRVYTAVRAGAASKRSRVEEEDDRPSRRRWDDEDRPSRRRREDEDEEDDDEDERPSRRRRDEEDEDERPRRRRRRRRPARRSGLVTTAGIFNYVLGGLSLMCTCGVVALGGFIKEMLARDQQRPGAQPPPFDPDEITLILFILGGVYFIMATLLIVAGIGVTQRKVYGRILTFITAVLAILLALFGIVNTLMNMAEGEPSGVCGAVIGVLIWGGYGAFALTAMVKGGREFS